MFKKTTRLSAVFFVAISAQCGASDEEALPMATASSYAPFAHMSEDELTALVLLEKWEKGALSESCDEDVRCAIACHGDKTYDAIRSNVSDAERQDMFSRLQITYHDDDSSVGKAVQNELFACMDFARVNRMTEESCSQFSLMCAHKRLGKFLAPHKKSLREWSKYRQSITSPGPRNGFAERLEISPASLLPKALASFSPERRARLQFLASAHEVLDGDEGA